MLKSCKICGIAKPRTPEFFPTHQGYLCSPCRTCAAANAREWREKNKARMNALVRDWKKKNPDKVKAWRDAYRERDRERWHRRYKENPEIFRARRRNQRAKREKAPGIITRQDVAAAMRAQKWCCWWCGCKLKTHEVDHRIPLARGGTNEPNNMVVSCRPCNRSKHCKMPWEMANPRLL